MSRKSKLIAALTGLTLPFAMMTGAVWAQETTQTPAEGGLAMGEPVEEVLKPGDTYIKEEIGDWSLRCVVVENGDDRCQLYQLLEDDKGQPIAEFTLLKFAEGGQARAAGTIIVPLETSLQNQLTIKVDDQPSKRYPFAFCNTIGCFSRIGLSQADVDEFKRGGEAVLTIVPVTAPDVQVNVPMSLSGFTAAFEAVQELRPNG